MSNALASTIFVGNDSVLRLSALADTEGAFQNDALVTVVVITDPNTNTPVTGVNYPITLAYVSASDGEYEGLLPHTMDVEAGRDYQATVRAITGGGVRAEWEEKLRVRVRRA